MNKCSSIDLEIFAEFLERDEAIAVLIQLIGELFFFEFKLLGRQSL